MLSLRLMSLEKFSKKFHASEKLIDLRRVITGGDFESKARVPKEATHRLYSEISDSVGSLVGFLNSSYWMV